MSDKPKIVAGLVVFLALATFPFWYPQAAETLPAPELEPPTGALVLLDVAWEDGKAVDLDSLRAVAGNEVTLSDKAKLVQGKQGQQWSKWRITDEDNRYLVVRSDGNLKIYDGRCVADPDYMTGHHMDLLNEWRDAVVREGDTSEVELNGEPVLIDGQPCRKSLTDTCMGCHTSRENFCTKCHEYANVLPFQASCDGTADAQPRGILCWDCHDESKGN